ncbi:isopentenyl-diphosphate Delta-isomerase [Candidatus Gottesmanbacteria bacterium]|nr:isopentenyl-diphosphate Delta-isomerase [Candidatus Gottesmanbacteria bacterium]
MGELVVLVDEDDSEIGTAPKNTVHTTDTPLHRGFSLFLFNSKKELLLTKRSPMKKTFPGVWTNTVCGHPGPGESAVDAALRRLEQELGLKRSHLVKKQGETLIGEIAPYRYRFSDKNGIVENEICPILVAYSDTDPKPDQKEIEGWRWMRWEEFFKEISKNPDSYSPWCREEAALIAPLI